jgi:GNAT superfamily N-acetyltransferase
VLIEKILLRDNTPVVIRSIRPDDLRLLRELHDRVSPISMNYRYLRMFAPDDAFLAKICNISPYEGEALVALADDGSMVGFACYAADFTQDPLVFEPSILIEDQFQGIGLGKALFGLLCQQAEANGITEFYALVHYANRRCMDLLRSSGYVFQSRYIHGLRAVHIQLSPLRLPQYQ